MYTHFSFPADPAAHSPRDQPPEVRSQGSARFHSPRPRSGSVPGNPGAAHPRHVGPVLLFGWEAELETSPGESDHKSHCLTWVMSGSATPAPCPFWVLCQDEKEVGAGPGHAMDLPGQPLGAWRGLTWKRWGGETRKAGHPGREPGQAREWGM